MRPEESKEAAGSVRKAYAGGRNHSGDERLSHRLRRRLFAVPIGTLLLAPIALERDSVIALVEPRLPWPVRATVY